MSTDSDSRRRVATAPDISETLMDGDIIRPLPATRAATRARLTEIEDAMAAIRTQIAAADLQRQASKKPIDPHWFHRAKTALRHLQRERAELLDHMGMLPKPKEALKDCVIAVLRERHDATSWARIMDEAHRRFDGGAL
jgi:hypothetical protein